MPGRTVQLTDKDGNNIFPLAGWIGDDTISTSMLEDGAVTTAKLASVAVTTAKIADDAITTDKIIDDAVTTDKIDWTTVVGDIDTTMLADGAVTPAKTNFPFLEMSSSSTPYIDFHYQNSTADYSARIINDTSNTLNLVASGGAKVNGNQILTTAFNTSQSSITANELTCSTSYANTSAAVTCSAGTYFLIGTCSLDHLSGGGTHAWVQITNSGGTQQGVAQGIWFDGGRQGVTVFARVAPTASTLYRIRARKVESSPVVKCYDANLLAIRIA